MFRSLFCVLVFAASLPAQDPAAVVKTAIETHGGADALKKARTAKSAASGTMMNRDTEVKFSAAGSYALPDKYRIEMTAEMPGAKLVVNQVLNGAKTKVSAKVNGVETALDPKVKEETVQAALLQDISTLLPLLEPKKYTLKMEKDADVNGAAATVIAVTGSKSREVKLFFDKATGRLVKTQRKAFGNGPTGAVEVTEETFMSDFKPFDKALMPTKITVNHDGKKFMNMTVTEWKFLDKADEKEFVVD